MSTARQRFEVDADGVRIVGYRYGAAAVGGPAVVLCPGFGGTQDTPSIEAAAAAFADAGIRSFTFDYASFGQSGGSPRHVLSVPRQLRDIRTVVDHVRDLGDIDPERVALWGSSLGGGHVMAVAAGDRRIAAVVAQVPFNGVARRVEGRPFRVSLALLRDAAVDRIRGRFGRTPVYVKIIGRPDERAVMGSDAAQAAIESMRSIHWRNEVAPRGLLDMMTYRPGRTVDRIHAPLLVCLATGDAEIPARLTRGLASRAPDGLELAYDVSHFDIYRPDIRARVLRDQTEFLTRALRPEGSRHAV